MDTQIKPRKRRIKQPIAAMVPVKKWLTIKEGAAFMDMHENMLKKLISDKELTLSIIGGKQYVRVSELEGVIEESIFRRKVS